jgi:hypothetical protein
LGSRRQKSSHQLTYGNILHAACLHLRPSAIPLFSPKRAEVNDSPPWRNLPYVLPRVAMRAWVVQDDLPVGPQSRGEEMMDAQKKNVSIDRVLNEVRHTTERTRELLEKSHVLQGAVELVHQRADKLHRSIDQSREKARKARERKQRKK